MSRIDERKQAALDALLNTGSYTEAAKVAGLSRRTIYKYLHEDAEFAAAYEESYNAQTLEQYEELARQRKRALEVITDMLNDTERNGYERLQAARIILDLSEKWSSKAAAVIQNNNYKTSSEGRLDKILGRCGS